MKKTIILNNKIIILLFCIFGLSVSNAQAIEDIKINSPKAEDKIRRGLTSLITWDTLDSKGNRTFDKTFEFFWAESKDASQWFKLQVGKKGNTFKDVDKKNKSAASGKVATVFPVKENLYIKMQLQGSSEVASIVGPIHIITPPATEADSSINGDITSTITLSNTKIYQLKGVVYVQDGGVLRIEPGTVVIGDNQAVSALVINRGGKIYAKGTENMPIVFTSPYAPGNRDRGDWGGILLMGSASTNLVEAAVEGGISDGANSKKNAWFGAWNGVSNDEDSSGVMEYVRIEFAGIAESPDNELNGLTLAGVGSKTIINNVQVSFSGDDSFEWFGGTVNCKHLIAFNGIDDDFDTDNGYRGKVQFAISYRTPQIADQSNSEAIESDNDAGSSENIPHTAPIFSNFTLIGPLRDEANQAGTDYNPKFLTAAQIRRNSKLSLFNSLIVGWTAGVEITNENTVSGFDSGLAELKNNTFIGIKGQKYFYFGSKTKDSDKTNANWFNSPENANEFISGSGNIANYANISNLFPTGDKMHTLNLMPTENASYSKTASFATEKLSDTFFEKVSFRGAFSHDIAHRWDAHWANYDPVNTVYKAKSNVEDIESAFANNIQISISPNPVVNTCLVRYENPSDANISIKIYNEMGKLVQQIANNVFQARGTYEFKVNAKELNQGTYFINISNDKTTTSQILKIIK